LFIVSFGRWPASVALELLAQRVLYLCVETAQLIFGPTLHSVDHRLAESQRKSFTPAHGQSSVMQGSGIDHGLGAAIAAKYHEQVAHHGRLTLVIEFDLALLI